MDRYDLAARGENDGLWDWNLKTGRIHFSPRWMSLLGCGEHEVGSSPKEWFERVHPDDLEQVRRELDAHLTGDSQQFESQHRLHHSDGTYRWMSCLGVITRDGNGQAVRVAGSHADMTAEKVVDPLTGLPNRLLFMDRLTRSIERTKRRNDFQFAVLILDLDRPDSRGENLGSTVSDSLLVAVARRLETCLRAGDTVARLGHDHIVARLAGGVFTILLDGLNEVGEAKTVAERLLKEISSQFEIGGHGLFLSASIGVALSATGYRRAEDVLRDADTALHRAKSLGGARCEIFDTAILESAQNRMQLENDLHGALERHEFSVVYQPIVELASNRIAGFEALVRWNHPIRGFVSPQELIPIAERTGFIVPLGRWVLHEACRQIRAWVKDLSIPGELWVSVNMSSLQFTQPSLAEQIREILDDTALDPKCLMLELTEGLVMENPEAASNLLMQLRVMGIQIGLDDFGTGYSSLTYLRQFPVDCLKIDHSFVRGIETSKDTLEIVRSICGMARQLGLHVVAEGIESVRQLELIRSLNCEYGQGYLFSKAVNSQGAEALLKDGFLPRQEDRTSEAGFAESAAVARASTPEPASAPAPDFIADDPPIAQKIQRLWEKRMILGIVLTTLMLLLIGGWLARLTLLTSPPSAYSSPPDSQSPGAAGDKTSPAESKVNKPALQESQRIEQTSQALAGLESQQAASRDASLKQPPPAPRPARKEKITYTYPVIHDHALGNCRGTMEISRDTLSYVSDKEKDSFSFSYSECSWSLENERLTVKAGRKTYRFRSASADSKEENRSQLQKIAQSIAKLHPDIASKKQ